MLQSSQEKQVTWGKAALLQAGKAEKLQEQKTFAKSFHWNIHESAQRWSQNHNVQTPFLIINPGNIYKVEVYFWFDDLNKIADDERLDWGECRACSNQVFTHWLSG